MTIVKNNVFFAYTLLSILAIVILPAYVGLFLPPKFTELIVENTKNEAVRTTNHLIYMFIGEENDLANSKVIAALKDNDERIREQFHLTKLKLFLPDGKLFIPQIQRISVKLIKEIIFLILSQKEKHIPNWLKKIQKHLKGKY